jgi:hypothetical protein
MSIPSADPSLGQASILKDGDVAPPNHTPIAIFGGVAFAAVICFWAYHFGSSAACPTSTVALGVLIPAATDPVR